MNTWYIVPSEDDIEHSYHKYIDKVWKNGKWVYTYTRRKARNIIGIDQKKTLQTAKKNTKDAEKRKDYNYKYANAARRKSSPGEVVKDYAAEKGLVEANKDVIKAKKVEKGVQEAYNKTLLGKLDQVKASGTKTFNNIMNMFKSKPSKKDYAARQSFITKTAASSNYTPNYGKSSVTNRTGGTTQYSPTVKTKKTVTNNSSKIQYSPTIKTVRITNASSTGTVKIGSPVGSNVNTKKRRRKIGGKLR